MVTVVTGSGSNTMLATNGSSKRWTNLLLFLCALCSFMTPAGKRSRVHSCSSKLSGCVNLVSIGNDADGYL